MGESLKPRVLEASRSGRCWQMLASAVLSRSSGDFSNSSLQRHKFGVSLRSWRLQQSAVCRKSLFVLTDGDGVRKEAKQDALQVQASAEQLQHEVERLQAEIEEAGCGALWCMHRHPPT